MAGAGGWWPTMAWTLIGAAVAAGVVLVVVVILHPGHRRHRHLPDGEAPPD